MEVCFKSFLAQNKSLVLPPRKSRTEDSLLGVIRSDLDLTFGFGKHGSFVFGRLFGVLMMQDL